MVKKRPLSMKKAKRACSICGNYTQGEVLSFSKEREHRNSVLMCISCVNEIKSLIDNREDKYICPVCNKEFASEKGLLIHRKKSSKCIYND